MKRFSLLLSLLLLVRTSVLADPSASSPAKPPAPDQPWSIVGTWDGTHPVWTGPLTFQADGTLLGNSHEDIGQWLLHVQDGHLLVVLCTRDYPAETACLVGPDDLLGSVKNGLLRLHRHPSAPAASRPTGFPVPPPTAFPLSGPLWDLLGTWDCTHGEAWSAPLTFRADGTFLKGGDASEGGRWTLNTQGGKVLLILFWNHWSAEVTTLFGADEFSGAPAYCDLRLRRRPAVPAAPPASEETPIQLTTLVSPTPGGPVEFRSWSQGEPPVKLIRADEGFCALTKITGSFQGGGESVQVHVAADGYWYLDGTSQQEGVSAECVVVRYRK